MFFRHGTLFGELKRKNRLKGKKKALKKKVKYFELYNKEEVLTEILVRDYNNTK